MESIPSMHLCFTISVSRRYLTNNFTLASVLMHAFALHVLESVLYLDSKTSIYLSLNVFEQNHIRESHSILDVIKLIH